MTSPFTKRRIVDIKPSEDNIDIEYIKRLQTVVSQTQLRDLIIDYEDFLPEELYKFKNCDEMECRELMFQARRFLTKVANKQPVPIDPTEAVMFLNPPLLSLPRGYAQEMRRQDPQHRYVTWGGAWFQLTRSKPDWINMICKQASAQTRQIIRVKTENKEQIQEYVDTRS